MNLVESWMNLAWAQGFAEAPAFGLGWLLFGGFFFLIVVGSAAGLAFRLTMREPPPHRNPRPERKNAPLRA